MTTSNELIETLVKSVRIDSAEQIQSFRECLEFLVKIAKAEQSMQFELIADSDINSDDDEYCQLITVH